MRTETITLYSFEELAPEAQERAITDWRNEDHEALHFFSENCEDQIREAGFEDPQVRYGLSYSQGDGLSFSAYKYTKMLDLLTHRLGAGKEKTAQLILDYLSVTIKGNTGYYAYAAKSDVEISLEYYNSDVPRIEELVSLVQDDLRDIYMDLCKELEKQGYAEIEHTDSDEAIKETLIANEYEFNEKGKML